MNPPSYTIQGPTALLIHAAMSRCTRRPTSRLPQRCRYLQQLANVTNAAPQRFEFLLQFHRKNTRRLIQTAIDIHPRKSRSGASRSLQRARLRVAFFTRVDACHWRHSAAICASEGHLTAKTEGKVVKSIDKELLRVLEVSPKGDPRLADIYAGCSMSLAQLRSMLGSRRSYH